MSELQQLLFSLLAAYKAVQLIQHKHYMQADKDVSSMIQCYTKYDAFYEDLADRLVGLYGLKVLDPLNVLKTQLEIMEGYSDNPSSLQVEKEMYLKVFSIIAIAKKLKRISTSSKAKVHSIIAELERQLSFINLDIKQLEQNKTTSNKHPLV